MSVSHKNVPLGIMFLQKVTSKCCPRTRINRQLCYQMSILLLTYMAYISYHMTRKPISVVKNILHQNCTNLMPPHPVDSNTWCDWAPFDGNDEDSNALLGTLDSAFLFSYAIAMFFSGFVAERVNLRYFLCTGMILSGIFCYAFGIAKTNNMHSLTYFLIIQAIAGVCQSTGWPGVVTVVGKWFGKGKRGLIFGVWNSHTSIGNILGTVIAARYLETDWALSFTVPGILMGICGVIVFLFMVEEPAAVGCSRPVLPTTSINSVRATNGMDLHPNGVTTANGSAAVDLPAPPSVVVVGPLKDHYRRMEAGGGHVSDEYDHSEVDEETQVLFRDQSEAALITGRSPATEVTTLLAATTVPAAPERAVGFCGAMRIPGVVEFSLCLFFAKLVSYTFLYWLPLYIKNSTTLTPTTAADLSTLFDVGGILGAILAGLLSDCSSMPASTCSTMLFLAAPMMLMYQWFGTYNIYSNVCLLFGVGMLVNGPYALITTAVSAELGTHGSLEGNSKALATVTAIIDGTGSIGAAIGPQLAALVFAQGWAHVFYMLIICDVLALLLLTRLVKQELARKWQVRSGPIE